MESALKLSTSLLAVVVLAFAVRTADAAPIVGGISLGGFVEAIGSVGLGAATGLDFVQGGAGGASSGTQGGITSFGAGSGSFAGLSCSNMGGGCGTIQDIADFTSARPVANFLTLLAGTSVISFDLASYGSITRDPASNSLAFSATGTLHYTGFDSTQGTFVLTAQGDNITSFSAITQTSSTGAIAIAATSTPAVTPIPEPATLALVGGLLAALVPVRRVFSETAL